MPFNIYSINGDVYKIKTRLRRGRRMTREETVRNLLAELIDMIDNGSQRDLDRADEIGTSIIKLIEQEPVIDKIRAEIMDWQTDIHDNEYDAESHDFVFERIYEIIDKYKAESEG